jgi:PadR family transcriptional regulator, regulatory protein PadR
MSISTLSYAAAAVLQSIAHGYRHGFDVSRATGLPSGTVYPALRRLEDARFVRSAWEDHKVARQAQRPPRKYYEITASGELALAAAVARYRLLEHVDRRRRLRPAKT